jgi:gamma-glutamyltranspeptidase/glutathione hydrolase
VVHGAITTVHPLATQAAFDAFERGGNAVDAAVAAGLTLGVVDGFNSGIGGGCFILIRTSDGTILAIDGRETAPAAATRDMYLRNGEADPALGQTGALAVGIPGALAAYRETLIRHGRLSLAEVMLPAAKIAEQGFEIDQAYHDRLKSAADELREFPASRTILLQPDGAPWPVGHVLVQTDLARSYEAIATLGDDWFYKGPFAERTAAWMNANGGLITAEDFANYRVKLHEPVQSNYRGFQIVGFPPPSSGGVHVAQILNILEHFDLASMGSGSADFVHVVAEAMKLAFADRAFWLGDPDFASVPRGLIDPNYGRELARKIRMDRVIEVTGHGEPPNASSDLFGKHTTHFSTADDAGNWVAITATVNTTFGSKVIVPGTGIVLNNEMDDFSAQPGKPNFFGLVGNEANAIEPGKRPLSSMSPTIVLNDGRPVFSAGAAGGPTIISQTLLAIIDYIDFGMSPEEALARPRFHHQWKPDELRIETAFGEEVLAELEKRGHKLNRIESFGACQAIGQAPDGSFSAAHDPRIRGEAKVW